LTLAIEDFFTVRGKVVLVTGGSRGIGFAIAEGFVKAGARVYISSRKPEACEAAVGELSQHGECYSAPANVATAEGRQAVVDEIAQRESGLDVLINNAGALWAEGLEDYPESGWDKVFDLNVKGVFFLIQALAPLLKAAATPDDPGRIINIGSIDALHVPVHETYAYTSSKAAVHHLSRHLAKLLAPDSVTVNVIAPGLFRSKMLEGTVQKLGEDTMLEPVPLKRFVSPTDMAAAAIYLASPAGSYLTGVVLPVDGGNSTTV
jgi:NAD(P)-dependent dehydrogenase (short-subunit alcohol dehydrogenase family)